MSGQEDNQQAPQAPTSQTEPAPAQQAQEPSGEASPPPNTANVQHQPIQEVQHVRVGAGTGSAPRVQHISGAVQRRHLGRAGDVQDTLQVPHSALQNLRDAVAGGRTEEAISTLDGWLGAVEASQSTPPPSAAEGNEGEAKQ